MVSKFADLGIKEFILQFVLFEIYDTKNFIERKFGIKRDFLKPYSILVGSSSSQFFNLSYVGTPYVGRKRTY